MARDLLKYHSVFIAGLHLGSVKEYTPPVPSVALEDYRTGAMDAPIKVDVGMEALGAELKLGAYELEAYNKVGAFAEVEVSVRGAIERIDGTTIAVVHTMTGRLSTGNRGTWAAGALPEGTIGIAASYFKEEVDGEVVTEIDIPNMIRIINGVDQMEEVRNALGL